MPRWALIFLVIALIAGVLGFTDVQFVSASIAKVLFARRYRYCRRIIGESAGNAVSAI